MTFTLTKLPEKKEEAPEQFTLTKKGEEPGYGRQTARGVGQGGLDVLALGALPLYPIEKGLQALFGTDDEPGLSPQQEQRYGRQFDILTKMEQEGYVPSYGEMMELTDDEIGGGSGTSLARIQQMQQEIPEGGVFQEGVRRVTRSVPAAAFGGLGGVLGAEFTGLGAKEATKALGGGETAQTWADILGGLGYGLKNFFFKQEPSKVVPFVAQKEGGVMQFIEKQSPKSLEKRLHSLSTDTIKDFGKKINDITDRDIQQLSQFSAREIEDGIVKEASSKSLNKITPQEMLPQESWKKAQDSAEALYEAEKKIYSPLYESVRASAKQIKIKPTKSSDMAKSILRQITRVETSPLGYTQTANLVKQVLHDLTGVSPGVDLIKSAMESGNEVLLNSIYQSLNRDYIGRADKLMDLSVRLNDAINYESLTPSIKELLKPLQRTIKDELKETLKINDPSAFDNLIKADDLYKKTAKRFGNDAITNLRRTENPERLTDVFSQPSNLENLINLFGKNSQQVKDAERQIIDQISRSNTKTANDTFRQLEPFLSQNAKEAGKEVISLGDKLSVPGQRRALQQSMLEDVSQSISTGQPPNYTTRAMLTPTGYQTAKDTFSRSQSGRELFKTLEKKLVSDIFDPIIVNDQIDWAKAARILDNPNTSLVLNEIIGPEGMAMMKNMQNYGQNIATNLNLMKQQQPNLFNKLINKLDSPSKIFLAAVVGKAVAAPLWLTGAAGALMLKNSLASMITNQKALKALKNLGNLSEMGPALLNDVGIINSVLDGELA